MWYVIDADEDAHLIYGFQHEVTEDILRKALDTGTLDKHLQKVSVHKGDTYFVPAGTVHGIGKGILVAEIQESSNVTYRVYDYDRIDKNDQKRELHFDKAVQVMNMKVGPDVRQKPMQFSKGETLFLPAGLGRCLVVGDAELIKVRC